MKDSPSMTQNRPFQFSGKASTLERLAPLVTRASLCDQFVVPVTNWRPQRERIIADIVERFGSRLLAIRSSAAGEDSWGSSQAGAHLSKTDVNPRPDSIGLAIDAVVESYVSPSDGDQVLVQPMVQDVAISGVVLTRDLDTGGPYYVINYDDFSGRTDTVTSGRESKTLFVHRARLEALHSPRLRKLVDGVAEIETVTGSEELDIEFCITEKDEIFILQVRPLVARRNWHAISDKLIDRGLDKIRTHLTQRMAPEPGILGRTTILGEMPDWNPAEMIGTTPRPLALSLYKTLITDRVWAQARAAMGYRAVEGPLLVDFHGRPFVDVRRSLNSFLPADLPHDIGTRLVEHQIALLDKNPLLHDKVEFEIAITCRDFAFEQCRERLTDAGLGIDGIEAFETAITRVSASALAEQAGGIARQVEITETLRGDGAPKDTETPNLVRLRHLIDACRTRGTLPFAKLARHGFIGMLFLRSLVSQGVFSQQNADAFMRSIRTVAGDLVRDMHAVGVGALDEADFLDHYGHLRPGTYDILSPRYDKAPKLYLGDTGRRLPEPAVPFVPTARQLRDMDRLLHEMGYGLDGLRLLDYIAQAVTARERAKFSFTRTLSDALALIERWGAETGLSPDDLSFLTIDQIITAADPGTVRELAEAAREVYRVTRAIRMPHLIRTPDDIDVVRLPLGQPTFITSRLVTARPVRIDAQDVANIDDKIVMIESADPGFDWIFSHQIAGLITKFGGTNSHMAIRSAEFGLPAAIGCGERLFEILAKASVIELNCAARRVIGH